MKRLIVLFTALLVSAAANAGWPVFDASNMMENVRQLLQMQQAYERQYDQLKKAVEQVDAITGSYGAGDLLNSPSHRNARRYAPSSWQDTLRILEAGGLPGSVADVRAIYQQQADTVTIASAEDYNSLNINAPNAQAFERRRDTNYATLAIAQVAYNDTQQRMANYEALMGEIEGTANIKASSDVLARIAAENGITMAELIRLQSVSLQQQGAIEAQTLVDETNMKRQTRYTDYAFGELPTN